MYIYINICMYIHIYVCVYVCMHVCMYVCMYVCTCVCACVCARCIAPSVTLARIEAVRNCLHVSIPGTPENITIYFSLVIY